MNAFAQVPLLDICSPKQWKTLSASQLTSDGYPVYGANGTIGFYKEYTHEHPTLMITCRGATCGTINLSRARSYISGNAMALDELDTRRVDLAYLRHCLEHRGLNDAITGAAQPQITRQNLVRVSIPLPPLDEQRRIAAILDKADALRQKRKRAIALLDSLTQSIFLEMFGDPRTPISPWPQAALSSLGKVHTGKTPPTAQSEYFDGNIPFVTPGDLESRAPVKRSLSVQGAKFSKVVPKGSALVCCIGATIGKMGVAETSCSFNQQINAVEWGDAVNPMFGISALRFLKGSIISNAISTTLPILKKSEFEKLEIPVPPKAMQDTFAKLVEKKAAISIHAFRASEKENALFATLQHRAFLGEL